MTKLGTVGAILLIMAVEAWAVETTTPGLEPHRDWKDTVTLVSAIVAAALGFLNYGHALWKDRRKNRADGAYLAMRLAIVLEAYAEACADLVSRNDMAGQQVRGELPDWETRLPVLQPFPEDDEGWKALDPNVAGECLGLANKINGSQGFVSEMIEHDEHGIGRKVEMQACERGIEAWSLAEKLRITHRLRPVYLVFKYNEYLAKVYRKAKAAEEKRNRSAIDLLNEPV